MNEEASLELRELVAECLERIEAEGEAAIEAVCAGHPEHAGALRRRLEHLRDMGLLELAAGPDREFPERLGDFRLIERLGGGGMGVVYLAEQVSLGREVALKVVRPEQLFFAGARERFAREVGIVAGLQHPGIVPVYTVGEENGVPFFAMEHVHGCSLADVLGELHARDPEELTGRDLARAVARRTPGAALPEDDAQTGYVFAGTWEEAVLRVVRQVAEALDHAHQRGVLHRDVKPSNVVVTPAGRAMLLDFGLSSQEGTGRLTRSGAQIGSLHYMSPEQARGEFSALSPATDVYSLGVTFYELATLRAPFEGGSTPAVMLAIDQGRAKPPRQLNPRLSWEAETVCLTAMEREPRRRYASAADLARDLGNVLDRRPIEARRASGLLRARRWVERHPARAVALALAVVLVAGGPTLYALQEARAAREIARERDAAQELAEDVLRLSALQDLDELEERAERLWPAHPDLARDYEEWLDDAELLLADLERHRRTRDALRARALDWTPADRERDRATLLEREEVRLGVDDRSAGFLGVDPRPPEVIRAELEQLEAREAELDEAGREHRAALRARVAELEAAEAAREERVSERLTWRFEKSEDQWWHTQLSRLIERLEALGDPGTGLMAGLHPVRGSGIARRLALAQELEERTLLGDEGRAAWDAAIAAIADVEANPVYDGLVLEPLLGLLPLGPDPASGLWEFAHLATGEPALRDPGTGELALTGEMGLVFVLLPGGAFLMGAQSGDPSGPNHDPLATREEAPVHEVRLAPFLMSKFELTQGQWLRFTGANPSGYRVGSTWAGRSITALNPVEKLTWEQAALVVQRLGLELPTEAQWEYAARGGTDTPWWTGVERESLEGAANLADAHAIRGGAPWSTHEEWLDDGHGVHAPAGSFDPNPFGLHQMVGNVCEWVDDAYGDYNNPVRDGDGARILRTARGRQHRDASFSHMASIARAAHRYVASQDSAPGLGLRPAMRVVP